MAQKNDFIERMAFQIGYLSAKIETLIEQAKGLEGSRKEELQRLIDDLQKKKAEAVKKLDELKVSGEAAWGDIRNSGEKIFAEMKVMFQNVSGRFK